MDAKIAGKTLLMLGGYPLMKSAIDKAHSLGARVIVTDWNDDAPAKQWADEAYSVSTTDIDALERLAKNRLVDGVFLGYVDVNLVPGAVLCERLDLPCYATPEQFQRTLDKSSFKRLCIKYGVPSVETLASGAVDIGTLAIERWPVIIKPTDSYSSKGISVCFTRDEASRAIDEAKEVSPQGEVIVEPFVRGDDVYLYFTVQDGVVSLSAMADRMLHDPSGSEGYAPQPLLYMFPSKYLDLYYEQAHAAIQRMVAGEGIRNGSFMMQGFVVQGKISFFEMGLRLTGGAGYINIRHQNKIDQLEMHIRFALGEGFGPWPILEYDCADFGKPAAVMVPLLTDGEIGRIDGISEIRSMKSFVDMKQLHTVGDVMQAMGTLNQSFARIYLCAETEAELCESIIKIKSVLRVEDTEGNNMLLDWFSDDSLHEYVKDRREMRALKFA